MDQDDTIDPVRKGFGMRLMAARKRKGLTQQDVADVFGVKKGTVSAWENGRGDPGVIALRKLAKLYDVSADALLWEDSLSPEAMQVAAQFDHLTETQQRAFRVAWTAFVQTAATDERVSESIKPVRWEHGEQDKRPHSDDRPPYYGDLLGGDSAFGGLGSYERTADAPAPAKRGKKP